MNDNELHPVPSDSAVHAALLDASLSFRARGLLAFLLVRGGNQMSVEAIARDAREGRDAIRSILRELRAAGYLPKHRHATDAPEQARLAPTYAATGTYLTDAPTQPGQALKQARLSDASRCPVCTGMRSRKPNPRRVTYLAQRGRFLKIGSTIQLQKRMATLAKANPGVHVPKGFDFTSTLRLLGTTSRDEHVVHELFAGTHAGAEWFHVAPVSEALIEQAGFASPWCGACDQRTRFRLNGESSSPCADCHASNPITLEEDSH